MREAPELAQYLTELNTAIAGHVGELRDQVAREQPTWTAGLGPRPEQPAVVARWDELAGLAAAYRETYNITNTDPAAPLGPQPGHRWRQGPRLESHHRPVETAGGHTRTRTTCAAATSNALRDRVSDRREHYREDTAAERVHDHEETAEEDYRRDDDEQLDEDTDFHSGLGY